MMLALVWMRVPSGFVNLMKAIYEANHAYCQVCVLSRVRRVERTAEDGFAVEDGADGDDGLDK